MTAIIVLNIMGDPIYTASTDASVFALEIFPVTL